MNSPYWFEAAVMGVLIAIGNILLGHFEAETPKWRRVGKVFIGCGLAVFISATFGRTWFYVMLGVNAVLVAVVHCWWLPVRKGVHGWTAEPREKYYALRGWKWPPPK
ncbi:MAG: hypothetical protein HYX71_01325 [Opitutae bacterium]|nr:hypothetical protein [Opitutae bacterium]